MPTDRVERRLAAILAADVAGYSRLIGLDEEGTLARLKAHRRELIDARIAEHKGRVVKTTGDGILIEFPSVVAALRCAVEVQRGIVERNAGEQEDRRIEFRVGIHQGDIVVDGADILGDGVNVAARLETIAEPGGICISARVHEDAVGRLDLRFEDMGEQQLKNIARSVRVYRVALGDGRTAAGPTVALALPDKPSIAVLPFNNMSGDPEQEYFVDGMVEDLITDLSKVPALFVIARHSSFSYKGKPIDIRKVAREMGVRYVLEGSARRAASRIRINAQLIDAQTGGHLWADRYDRDLTDVFAVQDEIVATIARSLVSQLSQAPEVRARYRPVDLEAYDLVLRARHLLFASHEGLQEARRFLERATSLDPRYAEPHAWLALSYVDGIVHWNESVEETVGRARHHCAIALALDPRDSVAWTASGVVAVYWGSWEDGQRAFKTAIEINPNNADAWLFLSDSMMFDDRAADGLEFISKALRLNPHPPSAYYWVLAESHYAARNYELAVEAAERLPSQADGRRFLAAALAQLGRFKEAREVVQNYCRYHPEFTITKFIATRPFKHAPTRDHFVEGFRKAGLPE